MRDPQYFKQAVLPLLEGKFEKTLIDYFLVGDKAALLSYFSPEIVSSLQPLEVVLMIAAFVKERKEECEGLQTG